MVKVTKKLIKYNYSLGNDIKYIVIHDTGNKRKGADAFNHYRYFNRKNRRASAHYFVDDKEIIQTVEDFNVSWHCGDGKGKYGITNHNSIGIEICINEDGDYEKAVDNTIDLVKCLMEKYDIPLDRVVRHYDA
ncbi:peptidoglycan recognition protein family protein, partial [Paramaledivibacter caminithermalis]